MPTVTPKTEKYPKPDALAWLLRLRWTAMACQFLLILVISVFLQTRVSLFSHFKTPFLIIICILGFEGISNAILSFLRRKNITLPIKVISLIFFLDILLLTGLLYATGGAMNPFVFLYVLHIVFAAMILPPLWSLGLTIWAVFWYLLLFIPTFNSFEPIIESMAIGREGYKAANLIEYVIVHLQGMWVAFAITTFFLVYFVGKIRQTADRYFATEQKLMKERADNEKLASLTALAAGAAHELSTPLSTIAVVAGELRHETQNLQPEVQADIRLIQEQVAQCKEILYDIAAGAGEHRGEETKKFTLTEASKKIMSSIPRAEQKRIKIRINTKETELSLPFRTYCRVVRSLVKNSLEATTDRENISVRWYNDATMCCLEVKDTGKGMDGDTAYRAIDPFFTTRQTGMGLGLFLAKTMAERFGGNLHIRSTPGSGTTVTLCLKKDLIT